MYNIIHFCIYAIPAILQEIKQEMHEKRMFRREKTSISYSIVFNTEGGISLKTDELLEYIQTHCELNYISDLRNPFYLKECLSFLHKIDKASFSLGQWRYLYEYITGQKCEDTTIETIRKKIDSWCHQV